MSCADRAQFDEAIRRFDQANAEDPRTEIINQDEIPRELAFARGVYNWVLKLSPTASEELLLAARGHTLRRWMIPRETYPKTRGGYRQWRNALAQFHAEEADKILQELRYSETQRERVRALITRVNFPSDPDARTLEDADCLVFLETKLHNYIDEWGEEKTVQIIRRTLLKMSDAAKALATQLSLPPKSADILHRALNAPG